MILFLMWITLFQLMSVAVVAIVWDGGLRGCGRPVAQTDMEGAECEAG